MLLELTDDDFDAHGAGRARATTLTRPWAAKRWMLAWGGASSHRKPGS